MFAAKCDYNNTYVWWSFWGEKMEVSVRELKSHLSQYLKRVRAGEDVVITSHRHPVARLLPFPDSGRDDVSRVRAIESLRWDGGKPVGSPHPVRVTGKSLAEMVLEDRR